MSNNHYSIIWWEYIYSVLALGASSAVGKSISAPFSRVSLILQTQDANHLFNNSGGQVNRYKGIMDCFKRIYQEQGLQSFWRGNLANILRFFPLTAFRFCYVDTFRYNFPKYNPRKEFLQYSMVKIGGYALFTGGSLLTSYPLIYVQTRLATDVGKERSFKGIADCFGKTIRGPSGFSGLYRGFGFAWMSKISSFGAFLEVFDYLNKVNPYRRDNSFVGYASKFAIGQIAGISEAFLSHPYATLSARLQIESTVPVSERKYRGMADCIGKIYREEGVSALFKGFGAKTMQVSSTGVALVVYHEIFQATTEHRK